MTTLFNQMLFADLCVFLDEMHYNLYPDTCFWCWDVVNEYVFKSNKIRPKFNQWAQHFLIELFDLFLYLEYIYSYKLGGFEVFMDFAYQYSSSNMIIEN